MSIQIRDDIIEIRYKSDARILDMKGNITKLITDEMPILHWKIDDKGCHMTSEDKYERGYVTYKNMGYSVRNSITGNYFTDKCSKLIKIVMNQEMFRPKVYVRRIGYRVKKCLEYNGDFEELLNRYISNFYKVHPDLNDKLNVKATDIGCNLMLEDSIGKIRISAGPMKDDEIKEIYAVEDMDMSKIEIPKVAAYVDIDYWINPDKELSKEEIQKFIKIFSENINKKIDSLFAIVLE